MPYKNVSDAEKKNQGLKKYSDKAKRGWVGSFNSCMEDGGPEDKCYAIAYHTANKVDGRKPKKASSETMGAFGGQEYEWPEPRGWEIADYRYGALQDWQGISYQHYDTGTIIDFDARPFLYSDGSRPGTFEGDAFGQKVSGKWRNPDKISSVLSTLGRKLTTMKDQWKKTVPRRSGWKVDPDDTDLSYYIDESRETTQSMMVSFFGDSVYDIPDVLFGNGTATATISYEEDYDYTGPLGKKEVEIKNVSGARDIEKVLVKAEGLFRKWSGKQASEKDVVEEILKIARDIGSS